MADRPRQALRRQAAPSGRRAVTLVEMVVGGAIAALVAAAAAALLIAYARMAREMSLRERLASRLYSALAQFEGEAKSALRAEVDADGKAATLEFPDGARSRWRIDGTELIREGGAGEAEASLLDGLAPTSRFALGDAADEEGARTIALSVHLWENASTERFRALTVDSVFALRASPSAASSPVSAP